MCGIAGIVTRGHIDTKALIGPMIDSIAHRGPNGGGTWHGDGISLGHRRLSVLDLSSAGDQPMLSDDGRFIIVYNGEVYNFQELRAELETEGVVFRSRSDTEVILVGFQAHGTSFFERLNGMFALAIWDVTSATLTLARDRFGVKPLYFTQTAGTFMFGSEIKALLAVPGHSAKLNPAAFVEYFTFQNIFTNQTLFSGVYELPPGCSATFEQRGEGQLKQRRYWDYHFESGFHNVPRQELHEELKRLFTQAVTRQLISDVPVGGYLSGGIDSGAITAVASRYIPRMTSFTAGFDLSSASGLELNFDERARAEWLSYRFKTELYEVVIKAGDMEQVLPNLVWHLEDLRVGQCYPNYYVARLASKFVRVVLSGTGGDELFGGYPWRYYRTINAKSFDDYLEKYFNYWQRLVPEDRHSDFFQPWVLKEGAARSPFECFRSAFPEAGLTIENSADSVNASLTFECRTFLKALLHVEDRLSMAFGLETRVPFLDNDLVEFAMKLPPEFKLHDLSSCKRIDENEPLKSQKNLAETNDGKVLLREVLTDYLPKEYTQAIKQGFSAPDGSWFRGESIDYVKGVLLDPKARIYELLEPAGVRTLIDEHTDGRQNRRLLIWSLLCTEWWLRKFDGA